VTRAVAAIRPGPPSLRPAIAAAVEDVAFHPWSAIAVNVLWGVVLLGLVALSIGVPGLALVLLPLLALPTAACYRLAALIARGGPVSAADALRLPRGLAGRSLLVGVASVIIVGVLAVNLVSGLDGGLGPLGWAIGTAALWGILAGWTVMLHLWPLMADPARAGRSAGDLLRLAATVALARPARALVLVLASSVLVVAATVLFAALVTIAVTFLACLGCRWVLPAADVLEPPLITRSPASPG
jgi:hypothetical protein